MTRVGQEETWVKFPFLTVYEVEILNPDHAMFNSEIEDNPLDFNILYKNHYRAAEIK